MDERAISAIEDYMFDLFEPGRNWPKYEFNKRSYERWAAKEILESIRRRPDVSPLQIAEEYVLMTDKLSGIEHDDRNDSFIFSVAHDVATDILDILRAMN